MTECDITRAWLSAYLDGEIDARRRAAVEAHLAGCDACRQELAALRGVSACLQAWPAPETNPELSARFAEQLAARQSAARHPFAWPWARVAWAGGLAACLVLGVFIYRHENTPRRPPINAHPLAITNAGPVEKGGAEAGKGGEATDTVPPAMHKPERDEYAPPAPRRIVRSHPARLRVAAVPAPVMGKAKDAYQPAEPVLDPTLTAVTALAETPIMTDGAMVEMAALPGDAGNYLESTNESKVGTNTDTSLPVEEYYDNQPPTALAMALLAEAP